MEEIESPTGQAPIASFALNVIVNPKDPRLDIVFVHGFNGHPERTWTDKSAESTSRNEPRSDEHQSRPSKFRKLKPGSKQISAISQDDPVCWPRDLVPKVIPDARVLSYGYDAKIQRLFGPPVSTHTVYDISNDFSIALEGERQEEPERPIIFIAHSLGGIIVKDLLRRCGQSFNQNHLHIRPIFESTIGIIFFGTPHSGADPGGSLLHFGERVLKALGHSVNENVRASLLPTSDRLRELRDIFGLMARERRWKIHSFQEQYGFKALGGQKVVEDTSSYVNIPDLEIVEHINQDHSKMCRFSRLGDPEFRKVEAALRRMLLDIPQKEIGPQVSSFARPCLTEEQKADILESLKFDQIDARILTVEKAHRKTCKWVLQTQEYRDWTKPEKASAHQGFLWMKGNPGTGKSTLMKFAYIEAKKNRKKTRFIFSFFFNARGAPLERSTTGMYRSLLVQILEQFPNQKCIFDSPELGTRIGPRQTWAIEPLKVLLLQALLKLTGVSIVFFIDALDECDEDEIRDMIRFFENIGQEHPSINLSIFFSSRHYPHITINFGLSLCLEEQDGHSNDIANYIQSELRIGKSNMAKGIREEVQNKACGVFMWVVLVVAILNKEYDNGNMHTLKKRLKDLPSDLYKLFEDIILRDDRNRDSLLLCIQWVLFAKTPLSPEQLYFAIRHSLESSPPEPWDSCEITLDTIKKFLLHSSKGLAEITKSKQPTVQFIHESVREFFLKNTDLAKIWPEIGPRFEANSHEKLKHVCLSYSNYELEFFYSFGRNPTMFVAELDLSFPLLKYCVQNIIHHADMAENGGVDQLTFISCFDRSGWIRKNNIYEIHKVRQYTPMASLLYILAEADAPHLIQRCSSDEASEMPSCLKVEDERYGCPFFASIATKSFRACNKFHDLMAPTHTHLGMAVTLPAEAESPHQKMPNFSLSRTFKFSKKKTVLSQVIESGNEDLVSFFLQRDIHRIKAADHDANHLLHLTAQNGRTETLKFLLENSNANPESKDASGRTPLMSAASGGHVHAVRSLLDIAKVDPNMTDSRGHTAISHASEKGESEVIKILLKVDKVDPNIAATGGRTPISYAAQYCSPEIIKAFLAADTVNPNLADRNGRTPLSWAVQNNFPEAINAFLTADTVNPNLADRNGRTPLSWAAQSYSSETVKALLTADKVDPNLADKDGRTPLLWAAQSYNSETVKVFLTADKVDPNLADKDGRTPLSWAAEFNLNRNNIEAFLAADKVDPNLADNNGETPLSWAIKKAHEPIANILLMSPKVNPNFADHASKYSASIT